MHVVGLLLAGTVVLREGEVRVHDGEHRDALLAVRRGEMPRREVDVWHRARHREFEEAYGSTKLPELPDYARANEFLMLLTGLHLMRTGEIELGNNARPAMTIDGAAPWEARATTIRVSWAAFDGDSEDCNGNGGLDVDLGEDWNRNGVLDPEYLGVALDWHRLSADRDPATMTRAELDALAWLPCTRDTADPAGATDAMDTVPGRCIAGGVPSAPAPVGRRWFFSWDSAADVGPTTDGFLLRATPFDQERDQGDTVHSAIVIRPGH